MVPVSAGVLTSAGALAGALGISVGAASGVDVVVVVLSIALFFCVIKNVKVKILVLLSHNRTTLGLFGPSALDQ